MATTWTERTDITTTWNERKRYLLQEIGDFLLLESGGRIGIGRIPYSTPWAERTSP